MQAIINSPNLLRRLREYGQTVWLDDIQRRLITNYALDHLLEQHKVRGMPSDPAIFNRAISDRIDSLMDLEALRSRSDPDATTALERLVIADIHDTADNFMSTHRVSQQDGGHVSMGVSPGLAADIAGTLAEARRIWRLVDHLNLLIKVSATPEGLPAIETLLTEGVNVNATLLFSVDVYTQAPEACLGALEARTDTDADLLRIASVAMLLCQSRRCRR